MALPVDMCQIAPRRYPRFASNFDPLTVPECHGSEGFGAVMGMALLERLERREGVARPEFQPLQQQIFPRWPRGQLRFLKRQESLPVSMISQ